MTPFNRCLAWAVALVLTAGADPSSLGQEATKTLTVSRVETPPRIDGLVDNECWRSREPASGFFQCDPVNGDKRTSITFEVNPKGVQKNSVETIWKSKAEMREDGWSAEMAIPFKSLRFSAQESQVLGATSNGTSTV